METDDGGWTLITEVGETLNLNGTVEIDDLALNYKDVMWVADSGYYMDLNSGWKHDWDFNGWNLEINMFKFNGNFNNIDKIKILKVCGI